MIRHGIILETGSHGRAQPYGIRSDLYAKPPEFAADCAAKGHGWSVTQEVIDRKGVSYAAMKREAA